ncbi:MAG TPA: ribose 5-phosphate isomerase B, partial [Thermoanaerobaculia bacterium]|nr:ribose 5-phosphate isomerase B [Thermoanaerobaculia bacterium]
MAAAGRVVLAADHGGFVLKEAIKRHLKSRGVDVLDVGTSSTEPVDYPVFARAAAEAVASGQAERGIVVDGAGIGSAMVANKVAGVRAGMAFDLATAKNAREHNDANVLTLGAGYLAEPLALQIVDVFLSTECTAERHRRRVAMIDAIDANRGNTPEGPRLPAGSRSSPPMSSPDFDSLVGRITQILAANPSLLVPPTCAGCAGCAAAGATECPAGGHCVTRC